MTVLTLTPKALAPALKHLAPRQRVRSLAWFEAHIQTHEGRPYDHGAFPHLGAPGGPCDALDDPTVRTVWLQFASRLGKTFLGTSFLLLIAAEHPCPMMFASSDQKTATDVIARVYATIGHCKKLSHQLRAEERRNKSRIDLDHCRIHTAWSRSVSTLADKAVKVGHANEIDKWLHQSTSKEADPLKLFTDRGKEYPTRKFLFESTPTIKGASRIEHGRLGSTNCSYFVPCPHCGCYQKLLWDRVTWDKLENGKSDKELARTTAHYRCISCEAKIVDHHRGPMMRAGVWVPEGCGVDDREAKKVSGVRRQEWRGWSRAPWIAGHPVRDGVDAGYQLSSIYALSLGWGDLAAEFVASKDKPQDLRNFVNQWLGETWEIIARQQTWEQLGKKIIGNVPRSLVPIWGSMLTIGIDRQKDHFVYVVKAWGPERRHSTIAYGDADTLDEIRQKVIEPTYGHEDKGDSLRIAFALCDSGYKPDGVYEFCIECNKKQMQVWPCKGSSTALNTDYKQVVLGPNTSLPGMILFHVDTIRTQGWIDRVLHILRPEDPGGMSLHAGDLMHHQDYLEQLLNDAAVTELDKTNNERESWTRLNSNIPNDFRDAERYAYVAMLVHTRNAPIRGRAQKVEPKKAVICAGDSRPDGRPWL